MSIRNKKIISLIAFVGLVVGAILFYTSITDTPRLEPSKPQAGVSLAPPKRESQPSPEEKVQIPDRPTQVLSPAMHQAINSFVGKGRSDPEIETLKDGGNIARLEGRYRHVTVVTIDDSGAKKLQEYGPHGVQEGK